MYDKVIEFMEKHELIKNNATVLIGVSGGPDSMALLHFYLTLKEKWKLNIIALSADHELRGDESREDLKYVRKMCEKWGLELIESSLDVKAYKKEKQLGTQVAAREMRYKFFADQMNQTNADYLALGHHGDDQVETMFMSLARSTSTTALSGIPAKRKFCNGHIVRPFLCITKSDIIEYCNTQKIKPRIDSSNEDSDYTRNYFRKYLIPIIKERNNNIHTTVQHLSESLQIDENYLQKKAEEMVKLTVKFNKQSNQASFLINTFKSYSLSLQRRAYHLILNYLYSDLPLNLSYVHENIFFSLINNHDGNKQVDFPDNLKIKREYDKVYFTFTNSEIGQLNYSKRLSVPGKVNFPNGSFLTAEYTDHIIEESKSTFVIAKRDVDFPIHIRNRKPGDRMSWKGLAGSKKIKDIFIDEKIPRNKRNSWPIVTDNSGRILWLVGLRKTDIRLELDKSPFIQLKYYEVETN